LLVIWLVICATFSARIARADIDEKDLKEVKVTLQDALKATEALGTPISAKFEVEDGKLQLSVYTAKGDRFSEVIVDHRTGKVAKTEAITSGDDLKAAEEQSAAIGKAKGKGSLRAAVTKVLATIKGARAVSVLAKLDGGQPVAEITLLKGGNGQVFRQRLD